MPVQRGLLVASDRRDRERCTEELPFADDLGGAVNLGEQFPRDAEQREQLVVPFERRKRDEQGSGCVGRVGDVSAAARELPDEPAVHRAEREPVHSPCPREQPFELGRREVRVRDEPGVLEQQVGRQLGTPLGRPPVLPHDRPLHGPPARPLPEERRLTLVRDPDAREVAGPEVRLSERGLRRGEHRLPDLFRVVLHPPRLREVLRELRVAASVYAQLGVDDEARRPGRPLVDCQDHRA
jgi:hypothetical protein